GDYNGDGNLDLIVSGYTYPADTNVIRLYRNNGDGTFTPQAVNLPALRGCCVAWGDYDNDGDLDLLLAGLTDDLTRVTKLFRNDGGQFVDSGVVVPQLASCAVAWGD